MTRRIFLTESERRRRLARFVLVAVLAFGGVGGLIVGVVDNSVAREADRRVAAMTAACPYYEDGEPLANSTRYTDGTLVCRYNGARRPFIQKLNRPNPKKGTPL